jgi:hypothetical protein
MVHSICDHLTQNNKTKTSVQLLNWFLIFRYSFLTLYRATKEKKWLHRAIQFGFAYANPDYNKRMRTPDRSSHIHTHTYFSLQIINLKNDIFVILWVDPILFTKDLQELYVTTLTFSIQNILIFPELNGLCSSFYSELKRTQHTTHNTQHTTLSEYWKCRNFLKWQNQQKFFSCSRVFVLCSLRVRFVWTIRICLFVVLDRIHYTIHRFVFISLSWL